ncbi:MAG: hypothetical protein J6Q67_04915 [Clostridia bacterium]|nr:hypothetical protein [Clostridia bacterium]
MKMFDEDIKIASPDNIKKVLEESRKIKAVSGSEEYKRESAKGNTEKAKVLGSKLANEVVDNISRFTMEDEPCEDALLSVQKGVLMTFAAIVCLEAAASSVVAQAAKSSFNKELETIAPWLYKAVSDSNAFTFYYLAYRRGAEVDRRIGQTFAMLCSHDGDPIYQELGEAIYCWFSSKVADRVKDSGIE